MAGNVSGKIISSSDSHCNIDIPSPCAVVIFGASGDLTKRKIIPSLYRLFAINLLPDPFFVIGTARTQLGDNDFRESMREAVKEAVPKDFSESSWLTFSEMLHYHRVEYDVQYTYAGLKDKLLILEKEHGTGGNRIYYLATPPTVYEPVIENLGIAGLSKEDGGYRHIVVEKPIGSDLESAVHLNKTLAAFFTERQIYRMDHYLAKETVQNILMFRFANSIFEPIWNSRYIDHVQITASETLGVEHRAGYYEKAGVVRDMFQNHIFQLLALTAMEPPALFDADRVRDEKVKVFRSIRPFQLDSLNTQVVVGQYGKGTINGKEAVAYRDESGVFPESTTPTYAALKVHVDNWRWKGVPFYLRSGKRLRSRKAEIAIHFKPVPHLMFSHAIEDGIEPNVLILRVQPDEGIGIHFQAKNPGSKVCLNTVLMNFSYQNVSLLDGYERVLLDCMQGDQMLFVRSDGVQQTWTLLTPLIDKLTAAVRPNEFPNYESGSSGPAAAEDLMKRDGRVWRPL
ncbi:MAG: glucose-6-phosphate dehydrogenase [Nitrospirae bacterium]|nr:glucose-6-phosphate dehydrogenase [Nitrospirota bacterium]